MSAIFAACPADGQPSDDDPVRIGLEAIALHRTEGAMRVSTGADSFSLTAPVFFDPQG